MFNFCFRHVTRKDNLVKDIKFKIRGKLYRVIEEIVSEDSSIVKHMYKVVDCSKQEYTLVESCKNFTLYKDNKPILKTYSIKDLTDARNRIR